MIWLAAIYAALAVGVFLVVSTWDNQPGQRQLSTRDRIMAGLAWPAIVVAIIWLIFDNDEDYKS